MRRLRDIKDTPTIKAQSDPIKYLDEELMVTWQDGSEVIRITFKSGEPQDAKKIVDAKAGRSLHQEVIQKDVKEKQVFLKKVEEAQLEMKRILEKSRDEEAGSPGRGGSRGRRDRTTGKSVRRLRRGCSRPTSSTAPTRESSSAASPGSNRKWSDSRSPSVTTKRRQEVLRGEDGRAAEARRSRRRPLDMIEKDHGRDHPEDQGECRARTNWKFPRRGPAIPNAPCGARTRRPFFYEAEQKRYEELTAGKTRQARRATIVRGEREADRGQNWRTSFARSKSITERARHREDCSWRRPEKQLLELPHAGRQDRRRADGGRRVRREAVRHRPQTARDGGADGIYGKPRFRSTTSRRWN